jgi:predicted transposase/invertase (TIGR01784 family)
METNRRYKDSVFTKLFGEKDKLLELYNAIENKNYGQDTKIEITTLENVIYMDMLNDISFLIDGKIVVLIEHQSTINPNMPLRMLLYIARVYEKIIENDSLYRSSRIQIPYPEFIVLYNGKDECPDKQTLKLSEMFKECGEESPINMELEVRVFNINKGHNPELAQKSKKLNGYETFIEAIREYGKTMSRDEAIKKAIDECIRQNVLKEFLEKYSPEVGSMLITEWNWDDAKRVLKEEGRQEGMLQGMQQGMQNIFALWEQGVPLSEAKKKLGLE